MSMNCAQGEHLNEQPVQWQADLHRLACLSQGGDQTALNQLALELVPRLETRARCRFYRTQDFQDLAHDAWCRIQKQLSDFDPTRPFWPWVSLILDRLCIDAIRKGEGPGGSGGILTQDNEHLVLRDPSDARESPSTLMERRDEFLKLWIVLWRDGGYPHQQLAFGYCKMIYGDTPGSKGRSAGAPTEVCKKHGRTNLDALADHFFNDFLGAADVSEGTRTAKGMRAAMKPLFDRLGQLFGALVVLLMPHDDCRRYGPLAKIRTGETSMSSYVDRGDLQGRHISDWSDKVRKRIIRTILSRYKDDSTFSSPAKS
jgi:hypothetical protein